MVALLERAAVFARRAFSSGARARALALGLGALGLSALGLSGCTPKADASCEAALLGWVEAMTASHNDSRRLKDAYAFLGPETRASLEARAVRTSARLGRRMHPHEILAEGRIETSFEPVSFAETMNGSRGELRVMGAERAPGERSEAKVRCAYENGRARVELDGLGNAE